MNNSDAVPAEVAVGSAAGAKRSPRRRGTPWRELIEQQAGSGLSIAAFCREHHLPQSGFYQWRRRLRSAATSAGVSSADFVRLEPVGAEPPVTVRFGDRVTLHCAASHLPDLIPLLLREVGSC